MKKYVFTAIWILIAATGGIAATRNQSESIAAKRIESFTISNADMHLCLQRLSFQNGIPIGLEMLPEIRGSAPEVYFDIDVRDRRLGEVLDEIVASDDRYLWKEVNGAINVFPAKRVDTFLDVVLPEFRLENTTRASVLAAITRNELFLARTSALGICDRTITSGSLVRDADGRRMNISLTEASVRDILNELIKQDSRRYWVVQIYGLNLDHPPAFYTLK